MCIKGASKITWKVTGLSFKELPIVLRHIRPRSSGSSVPIDVDVSNIVCKICMGKEYKDIVNTTATNLKNLAHHGNFYVTAVLDGLVCPGTKREYIKNKANHELLKIDSYFLPSVSYCTIL